MIKKQKTKTFSKESETIIIFDGESSFQIGQLQGDLVEHVTPISCPIRCFPATNRDNLTSCLSVSNYNARPNKPDSS